RERYSSCHRQAAALRRELEELAARAGALERDRDLLAFEIEEIEELDPSAEDEELLAAERERLRRLDALRGAAGAGAEALAQEGAPEGCAAAGQGRSGRARSAGHGGGDVRSGNHGPGRARAQGRGPGRAHRGAQSGRAGWPAARDRLRW